MEIKVVVDLRAQFPEIRDQGSRPTCMAFAASDIHSFARGSTEMLSAEYAFFHAVKRKINADRTIGVPFQLISLVIETEGQPLEIGWPYLSNLSATDEWNPPNTIGDIFYRRSNILGADLASIYSYLNAGQPVILIIKITRSFFQILPNSILSAAPSEPELNTHAVVAIGYGEAKGERCVLIRNSWGAGWGDSGNAWIHENYLKIRLLNAGVMI